MTTRQASDGADRFVLVAGAAGGIGSACALALARAGFGLVLVGRRQEQLDAVGDRVNAEGARAVIKTADLSDPEQVEAAVTSAPGTLWGCVHAAGTNRTGPTLSFSDQDFDLLVQMNIRSTFLLFRAAARRMISTAGGRLVAISSQMGSVGYPGRAAYCASKHAVNGLVRALAVEWAGAGVTVNAVAPTFVETELTAPMFKEQSFLDDVLRRLPLGRIGTAEEVADVVAFLVSPQASLVTGSIVAADGGWTAW